MRYGHSGREPVYWCSPAGEETDHPREVIKAVLAHVVQNWVEAAYARSDLFERRRVLIDDWARYLAHRIRETWNYQQAGYVGPVEVDETYIGGKERNKHESKKTNAGRGAVGKAAVIGIKDRTTNQVDAQVLIRTDKESM